jgi:hypothetical protein
MKEYEMGGESGTHGKENKYIDDFGGKSCRKWTLWKNNSSGKILNRTLSKWDGCGVDLSGSK